MRGPPPFMPGYGSRDGDADPMPVSFLGVRTLWFDYEIKDVVAGLTGDVAAALKVEGESIRVTLTPRTAPPATQVLALGAGLDARPWRLALPGVDWFDVDGEAVASVKRTGPNWRARVRSCRRVTTQNPPTLSPSPPTPSSPPTWPSQGGATLCGRQGGRRMPRLQCWQRV